MKEIKLAIEGKTTDEDLIVALKDIINSIKISGLRNDEYTYDNLVINLVVS
jgi:hypothetical protein